MKAQITLYLVHGTNKALGFKKHQRKDTEKAANLIWIPKNKCKLIKVHEEKAFYWNRAEIEIDYVFAKKKNLI